MTTLPSFLFESGFMSSVPLDTSVSVEVAVARKSDIIRNFPCTVLQCPVVLTSLKASLSYTTVSTLKTITVYLKIANCPFLLFML